MAGRAEEYMPDLFRTMTERGWWLKKNTDMNQFGLKEMGVDYNLALCSIQVECKNSDRDGALVDKPTRIQTELLDKYGGFVFLIMWDEGYPRLPKGGDAYLVPWDKYKEFMQATSQQRKSVRRHKGFRAYGADEFLSEYRLVWKDGRWTIPPGHAWWDEVICRAEVLAEQVASIVEWRAKTLLQGDDEHVGMARREHRVSAGAD